MKSVSIYQKMPDGTMRRLGTFRPRKYYSVRSVSEQFCAKHPRSDPSELFIAKRMTIMGRIVDSSARIPFDCGTSESEDTQS
jgi:hypothetical protein